MIYCWSEAEKWLNRKILLKLAIKTSGKIFRFAFLKFNYYRFLSFLATAASVVLISRRQIENEEGK